MKEYFEASATHGRWPLWSTALSVLAVALVAIAIVALIFSRPASFLFMTFGFLTWILAYRAIQFVEVTQANGPQA